ncbi:MAG: hypothetical protein AAGN66_20745 [Acidobacteriota bacterium]
MLSPVSPSNSRPTAPIHLLRLAAEDPTFRAELESDPVAAFAKHGVRLSAESTSLDVCLPSQTAIQGAMEDLDPDGDDRINQWRPFLG